MNLTFYEKSFSTLPNIPKFLKCSYGHRIENAASIAISETVRFSAMHPSSKRGVILLKYPVSFSEQLHYSINGLHNS